VSGRQQLSPSPAVRRRAAWIAAGVLLAVWLLSGLYTVDSQERGVVLRFGKLVSVTRPGMHYALPWPVDRVLTPTVTDVRRLEVGFKFLGQLWPSRSHARRSDMLTGDENILKLMMVVQYKVREPERYLFGCEEPDWLVERAVESAMSWSIAFRTVDDVLTSAKNEIQVEAVQAAQELLDRYGAGIQLLGGNLQVVSPPEPVIAAFNDVTAAKKDAESAVETAHTYANYVVPGARGEASTLLSQARGQAEQRVQAARGEAQRFTALLAQYRRDPGLTRRRLYLETLERVMGKAQTVIVDGEGKVQVLED
jgi:membrane protease subunit HflK